MSKKIIAIALTLCLIPTSTANSQDETTSFNPDVQLSDPIRPSTCREAIAYTLQERGYPFDPRTQDILDISFAETGRVIDPESGGVEAGWLLFRGRQRRSVPFLSDRLSAVETDPYVRAGLAEAAAIAIALGRIDPLCQPPDPI
jgi:hypothetical protein